MSGSHETYWQEISLLPEETEFFEIRQQIFDILETTQPGAGGEIQLTDAMKVLARTQGIMAVDFVGTRYDMGDKLGMMKACVEVALDHPEIGGSFREYLKSIMKTI